jgi:hypothetical protein
MGTHLIGGLVSPRAGLDSVEGTARSIGIAVTAFGDNSLLLMVQLRYRGGRNVFARSITGMVGSTPTRGMDICVRFFHGFCDL